MPAFRRTVPWVEVAFSDMVAIDGSKFKASNSRDRNYTASKIDKRQQQIEESGQRYLDLIATADRTSPTGFDVKTVRLYEKIARLRQQMRELAQIRKQLEKQPDKRFCRAKGAGVKSKLIFARNEA